MRETVSELIEAAYPAQAEPLPEQLIRFPQVKQMTSLSRAWIWILERDGKFPRRVALGKNAVAWYLREVTAWCASRPRIHVGKKAA